MDLLAQVEAALDTIRPYLETDGGNVSVEEMLNEIYQELGKEGYKVERHA